MSSTKVCTGPAHPGPAMLPLTSEYWYFHQSGPRAGMETTRCRLCVNWSKLIDKSGPHGYIPVTKALRIFATELRDRCGSGNAVFVAHGIRAETLRQIIVGDTQRLQKKTAARILTALSEQRKYDRRNGSSSRFLAARRAQAIIEERLERQSGCG